MGPTPDTARARRTADRVLIGLFLVLLCLPAAGQWLGLADRFAASEKRLPAPMPPLRLEPRALKEFPVQFERHFNDTFAFRQPLIRAHGLAKVLWLNDSSTDRVVVGRDGWLFFDGRTADGSDPIADYQGSRPLSLAQLRRLSAEFCRRRDWLKARGIQYLLVVPPNKESLYPEFLPPARARRAGPHAQSPLDQIAAQLAADGGPPVLDLREDLLAAKATEASQGPLWRKTDSHWTDRGTFVAYRRIMQAVGVLVPGVYPAPAEDFDFVTTDTGGGDLAMMLDAADVMRDRFVSAVPRRPRRATVVATSPPGNPTPTLVSRVDDPSLPRLVMTRDSYAVQLVPLLAEHFSRAAFVWDSRFPAALIERERPAVVIDEWVERRLRLQADGPFVDMELEPAGDAGDAAGAVVDGASERHSAGAGAAAAADANVAADPSRCTGTLEAAGEQVAGWAWDPARPDAAVTVEVFADGRSVGTAQADIFRHDLVQAGKGNGRHGFLLPLPARLKDGRRHSISARVVGGPELAASPRLIGE